MVSGVVLALEDLYHMALCLFWSPSLVQLHGCSCQYWIFSDFGHQASASKRNVCNTLQEAKRWSKVRHHLKTELFAKHKPFYKVVLAFDQEPRAGAATASSDASGVVGPDKLVELAQVAEDSLLDAENGKALSDFLVKHTSNEARQFLSIGVIRVSGLMNGPMAYVSLC